MGIEAVNGKLRCTHRILCHDMGYGHQLPVSPVPRLVRTSNPRNYGGIHVEDGHFGHK